MFTVANLHLQIYYWGKSRLSARRRREIPGYATFVNVRGGSTDRHKITKLTPYTNYIFAITAYNSGGEGPASNEASAATEEDGKYFKEFTVTPILTKFPNDPKSNDDVAWVLTLVGLAKPDWSVEGERSNLDPIYTYPDIFESANFSLQIHFHVDTP